jgi:hypothetical protein
MNRFITILLTALFICATSYKLFSQPANDMKEFGITTGGFTNFPANQNYLKENMSAFYLAPYLRAGQHEFSVGIVYPLRTNGLYFTDNKINPRLGAIAGYKFYIFNVEGRENLFIHYSFMYLRFNGNYDAFDSLSNQTYQKTESDTYINNVIGLGYNLFFDTDARFGLFYTLDYIISQAGYKLGTPDYTGNSWTTRYIWNNLSTHFGLSFKLTSLKKKDKKQK